ncbi:MAG: Uma2 family endonuclease [Solirubrobacteraceae bacterium]
MATATSDLPLYRLDVDTYHRLAEAGALDGMDVELLDGLLIDKDSAREDPVHRIDVGTYHRMVASGALEGKRIELLEGLLVEMSPKLPAHVIVVNRLMRHFMGTPGLWVQAQDPIEAAFDSEPEPDLAVGGHEPFGEQLLRCPPLAIEVAVTTQWLDRGRKAKLYAAADIPNYWLVDVPGRAVEVRTQPGRHGYEQCEIFREGSVVPSPLDGVADLDIAALLADV